MEANKRESGKPVTFRFFIRMYLRAFAVRHSSEFACIRGSKSGFTKLI